MIRLSFPLVGSVIPEAFVKEPSGPAADRRWAPRMHLRLSARQGREALLAGKDKEKTNMVLKHDSDNKSLLMNTVVQ